MDSQALMIAAADLARRGRALLGLAPLTPAQRRRCLGKWFAGAHDFAQRAAACRGLHAADLDRILPFSDADIEAQRQRVLLLERAEHELSLLAQDARDTLLHERARLYQMSAGVLRGLAWLQEQPFQDPAARLALSGSLRNLRKERDRKNEKIARSKRRAAQALAARADLARPGSHPVAVQQLDAPEERSIATQKDLVSPQKTEVVVALKQALVVGEPPPARPPHAIVREEP